MLHTYTCIRENVIGGGGALNRVKVVGSDQKFVNFCCSGNIGVMENLKKHLKEFCEETSLNGWFFVAKDGLSWTRKYVESTLFMVFEGNRRQICWCSFSEFSGFLSSWRLFLEQPTSISPSSWSSLTQPHWFPLRCNILFKGEWQIKILPDCGSELVSCYISGPGLVQPEPGQNLIAVANE